MASNFPNRKVTAFICQQRKIHNDPALYIHGIQIPVVAESKFLGVIFDTKTLLHTPYKKRESEMFKSIKHFISHKLGKEQLFFTYIVL